MQTVDEVVKLAAKYIISQRADQNGIDKLKPLILPGFNSKIIGFLFIKSSIKRLTKKNFASNFSNDELTKLYNDLKEADKKNMRVSLEPTAEREMIETLFRYATVLGFLS